MDKYHAATLAKIEKALKVVKQLCEGEIRWTMSVPAQLDSDPDLVIADALGDARSLIQALPSDRPSEDAHLRDLLRQALGEITHYEGCPQDAIPPTGKCNCFGGALADRIQAALDHPSKGDEHGN